MKEVIKMNNEEKYLIALFTVIRNSQVIPKLQGYSKEQINAVAYRTLEKIVDMIDYDAGMKSYLEGKKVYENARN